jgi:hypothetical protein
LRRAPAGVPQSNDVRTPSSGTPIYEACTQAAATGALGAAPLSVRSGCVIDVADP